MSLCLIDLLCLEFTRMDERALCLLISTSQMEVHPPQCRIPATLRWLLSLNKYILFMSSNYSYFICYSPFNRDAFLTMEWGREEWHQVKCKPFLIPPIPIVLLKHYDLLNYSPIKHNIAWKHLHFPSHALPLDNRTLQKFEMVPAGAQLWQ